MKTNIEPGCWVIVIGGAAEGLGRHAYVLRWVEANEPIPEFSGRGPAGGTWYIDFGGGWFGFYETEKLRRIDGHESEQQERRDAMEA